MKTNYLCLVILVLLISGCSRVKQEVSEREEMGLRGNVESVVELSYSAYEDGKELVIVGLERSDFANMPSDFQILFDRQGQVIQKMFYYDGLPMMWNNYYYENELLMFSEVFFAENSDSIPSFITTFTYNKEDKLLTSTMYDSDSAMMIYQEYSYDPQGNLYDETVFDSNKERLGRSFYQYNKLGQLIELRICGPEGDALERRTYSYDRRGEIKESHVFDYEDMLLESEVKKYDSKGNVLTEKYVKYVDEIETTQQYSYNRQGDVEKVIYQANVEDGSLVVEYHYEYDEQGNWTECIERQDGEVAYLIERHITYFNK